jgi:hypothetical protein
MRQQRRCDGREIRKERHYGRKMRRDRIYDGK